MMKSVWCVSAHMRLSDRWPRLRLTVGTGHGDVSPSATRPLHPTHGVVVVHDKYRTMLEAAAFWPEVRDVTTASSKRWKTLSSVQIGRESTGGKPGKGGNLQWES